MTAPQPLTAHWAASRALDVWPPGGLLHHCHQRRYRPAEFNGTGRPHYRFSPIHTPSGEVVPTWYAAGTPEGAVAESILHDIPMNAVGAIVTRAQYQDRIVSPLRPTRPLRLIRLDSDGLRRLHLDKADVTETEADGYPHTVTIAQHLYESTDADGLAWVSRRRNTDCAVMLFGDRVAEAELQPQPGARELDTLTGWTWLFDHLAALGVELAVPI